jgi:hypothetical protein
LPRSAGAADDDARSRAYLDRAGELSRGERHWDDRQQTLALEIVDRRGGKRHRRLEMWTKRYPDEASRTTLIFREPAQARGVGFLQWVDPHGPDSQWLYLPVNKRVRQITGSRKKESFVGTDFSYEDLGLMMDVVTWTAADARSSFVREETFEGKKCAVIDLEPFESQDVSYGRLRIWMGVDDHLVYRYQFYDETGDLLKTLVVSDVRAVDGIPAPHRLEMIDAKAGSHTVAEVEALQFNLGLSEDIFTKRRLERGG